METSVPQDKQLDQELRQCWYGKEFVVEYVSTVIFNGNLIS
jgi:hypothetical protein